MGIRITDTKNVALYDSVSGFAFGPTFEDEADAEQFIEWHDRQHEAQKTFPFRGGDLYYEDDLRKYPSLMLEAVYGIWVDEREQAEASA